MCVYIYKQIQVAGEALPKMSWRYYRRSTTYLSTGRNYFSSKSYSLLGSGLSKLPTFIFTKTSPTLCPGSHHDGLSKNQHRLVLPGLYYTDEPWTGDTPKFLCWHTLNLNLRKNLSEKKQAIRLEDVSKGP